MANPEHLEILNKGVETWNKWREENQKVIPDLSNANLRGAKLRGAQLRDSNLCSSDLRDADLYGAMLSNAELGGANLGCADLSQTNLRGANLRRASRLLKNSFSRKTAFASHWHHDVHFHHLRDYRAFSTAC